MAYACSACCDTGADEGHFCPRECEASERLAAQIEDEHGWMRHYVRQARFYEQDGQPEAAEAIRRMCIT